MTRSDTDDPARGRPAHPGHGVHRPTSGTPVRIPGSIRRTVTFDMLRPDGFAGDLVLVGFARDLLTDVTGGSRVVATADLNVVIDYTRGRLVTAISTGGGEDGVAGLVGTSAASGFRRAAAAACPDDRAARTPRYALLDDVPVASLVAGHASGTADAYPMPTTEAAREVVRLQADYCAGWIDDGVMISQIKRKGSIPTVIGPVAGIIESPDDPLGWPPLAPLPVDGMRRRRRLDVHRLPDDTIAFDAFFRDSHRGRDGVEQAVHEYTLTGTVDATTGVLLTIDPRARALPWRECISATTGAQRLVGQPLDGLRDRLGREFTGPMSCTHLNDTLRSLEDVPALAAELS